MKYFFLYLFSKQLWKNILIMLVFSVLILGGLYFWLLSYTRHGQSLKVPDFYGLKMDKARELARKHHVKIVVIDTLNYDPDLPKYAIREQMPRPGDNVKKGRKIYVKINAARYREVAIPKVRGITVRQAKSMLGAMGLKVGKVVKKPYFAEVVLDIIHGKDTLRLGDKLPKNSVVTLVVGSGKEAFVVDTTAAGDNHSTQTTP
ncbi:MAG: PASTA domain-containing protein [Chlorobi bacterium]|nr:PASTA domain-containing protein [Chlorobiota bacterium]